MKKNDITIKGKNFDRIKNEFLKYIPKTKERKKEKIITAVLGSIPWFGAVLSTVASVKSEEELIAILVTIFKRLDGHDDLFKVLMEDKIEYSTADDITINKHIYNKDNHTLENESSETFDHSDKNERAKTEFITDKWVEPLRHLCISFFECLKKQPGGQFLHFREELIGTTKKPGIIIKEYHESAVKLRREFLGDNAANARINHHKIIALYIRAFLKYKPFQFDAPSNINSNEYCIYPILANEYFSLIYMSTIFKANNNNHEITLAMNENEKFDFIKLLHKYKNNIDNLEPITFSYIINLIEQLYFLKKNNRRS